MLGEKAVGEEMALDTGISLKKVSGTTSTREKSKLRILARHGNTPWNKEQPNLLPISQS